MSTEGNPRSKAILAALDGGIPLLYAEDRKARREAAVAALAAHEAELARLRQIEEAARKAWSYGSTTLKNEDYYAIQRLLDSEPKA